VGVKGHTCHVSWLKEHMSHLMGERCRRAVSLQQQPQAVHKRKGAVLLQQHPQAVHERVQVPAHVVAAEQQRKEALHNGVEQLEFDVT